MRTHTHTMESLSQTHTHIPHTPFLWLTFSSSSNFDCLQCQWRARVKKDISTCAANVCCCECGTCMCTSCDSKVKFLFLAAIASSINYALHIHTRHRQFNVNNAKRCAIDDSVRVTVITIPFCVCRMQMQMWELFSQRSMWLMNQCLLISNKQWSKAN